MHPFFRSYRSLGPGLMPATTGAYAGSIRPRGRETVPATRSKCRFLQIHLAYPAGILYNDVICANMGNIFSAESCTGGMNLSWDAADSMGVKQWQTLREEVMNNSRTNWVRAMVLAALLPAAAAQAAVRYVALDGSGANGQSWATAYKTIQAAINDSAITTGGEIRVKQGVYDVTKPITVSKAVRIYGGYSGVDDTRDWLTYKTTINGMDTAVHCMWVSANATLDGFGILYGRAEGLDTDGLGGAVIVYKCAATITNCIFKNNYAVDSGGAIGTYQANNTKIANCTFRENWAQYTGGAIYNEGGTGLQIVDCSFLGNTTDDSGGAIHNVRCGVTITGCLFDQNISSRMVEGAGGAILNDESPAVNITNGIFRGNGAVDGAGVYNYLSNAVIDNCWFSLCSTLTSTGGGIFNHGGSPTIKDCLFEQNAVRDSGGAILDYGSTAKIINCILWRNSAAYAGGGIYISQNIESGMGNNPQIINCTIYGNSAGRQGGGVYSENTPSSFTNGIIWGNSASQANPGIGSIAPLSAERPAVRYSNVQGTSLYPGTGNKQADPRFVDVTNGDFSLSFDSPCLDAGNNAAIIGTLKDYAGGARVVDGDGNGTAIVDMGAVELQGPQKHVARGQIMWSTVYDSPADTTPTYTFMLRLVTADTLTAVDFQTPGSSTFYKIPSDAHTSSGNVETYHRVQGGTHVWEYWARADSLSGLAAYGSGIYRIISYYRNNTQAETKITCLVPKTTTPVPQPTQRPQVTTPAYGAKMASPVRLSWNACTDSAANSIYVTIVDAQTDEEVINAVLAKTATQSGEYRLRESTYTAEIGFGNLYEVAANDGTAFQYGKTVLVGHRFTVPYTAVYRFWSPAHLRHFYTASMTERDKLLKEAESGVWIPEGIAFHACTGASNGGLRPVYRLWSGRGHLYTISETEKNTLVTQQSPRWTLEGIAFYAYPEGSEPLDGTVGAVYRFANRTNGARFYTMKEAEANKVITQLSEAYAYEGVAFYAYRP